MGTNQPQKLSRQRSPEPRSTTRLLVTDWPVRRGSALSTGINTVNIADNQNVWGLTVMLIFKMLTGRSSIQTGIMIPLSFCPEDNTAMGYAQVFGSQELANRNMNARTVKIFVPVLGSTIKIEVKTGINWLGSSQEGNLITSAKGFLLIAIPLKQFVLRHNQVLTSNKGALQGTIEQIHSSL